ncbi:MAG: DNA polymerase IV [Firmicutes bacterium]|nr:DNA polymerase IV [Bacillota bacterium]
MRRDKISRPLCCEKQNFTSPLLSAPRVIIHLDMDAFFAAVEQLDFPELRGKPVIVGGAPNERGVVSTCSYEARKFGVRSAMSLTEAYRRCPQGIFVRGRGARYRTISEQLLDIMAAYSPLLEPVSIDEAFLDVTQSQNLFGEAPVIARTIQARVKSELGLSCSLGVAPNKFLAKLASDLKKPGGLVIIERDTARATIAPLPIERIWGVGPKTAEQLRRQGLMTIGDIQNCDPALLARRLGVHGHDLYRLACGEDDRPVANREDTKSVGHEHTFDIDTAELEAVKSTLLSLAAKVGRRLRKKKLRGKVVQLKLRYLDFTTYTRQCALNAHTDLDHDIYRAAVKLLCDHFDGRPVRLIGVSMSQLCGLGEAAAQLSLFDAPPEKAQKLARVMDAIKEKHGEKSITYAKVKE